MINLDILLLTKDNFTHPVWGGHWIAKWKGIDAPPDQRIGESWEFSLHRSHPSSVELVDGKFISLIDLKRAQPEALWGRHHWKKYEERSPFLLKIIDARENLSVQVHPPDNAARTRENDGGKTESWIILDVRDDDSYIYAGFKPDIADPQSFLEAGRTNDIIGALNRIKVRKGGVFHIPAGVVHAIGKGVRLCEIQQSSGATYRIWDWNRGSRPLHLEKAKEVVDPTPRSPQFFMREPHPLPSLSPGAAQEDILVKCKEGGYGLNRIALNAKNADVEISVLEEFFTLTVLEGEVELLSSLKSIGQLKRWGDLSQGRTALIPASLNKIKIRSKTNKAVLFKSYAL